MNNFPKVVTQLCPEQDLNLRPVDSKVKAPPVDTLNVADRLTVHPSKC